MENTPISQGCQWPSGVEPRHDGRVSRARRGLLIIAAAIWVIGFASPAPARIWLVGPDQALKTPSAAARKAANGDIVEVEPRPGSYYDCAVWHQSNLTIEGIGQDVRITDKTCQGKALFVITGNAVTIRNLTFARARVPDGNGAGIRAEGRDLLVENSRFINNQVSLLAASRPHSTIIIRRSEFRDNGTCQAYCTAALMVDSLAALRIKTSVFKNNHGRDLIRSRAALTELVGNDIEEGNHPAQGYLVEVPTGGSLVLSRNTLRWQGEPPMADAAVLIAAGYAAQPVNELVLRNNTVIAEAGAHSHVVLIKNWTGRDAVLAENTLPNGMAAVSCSGYHWFIAKSYLRAMYYGFRGMVHFVLAKGYHFVVRRS